MCAAEVTSNTGEAPIRLRISRISAPVSRAESSTTIKSAGTPSASAALALGVPADLIVVLDSARDTGAEIREIRSLIGASPVLLVTSAAHMPRAMAYCTLAQLHAVAAPAGNRTRPPGSWTVSALVPSGSSLHNSELALHEYLGMLALRIGIT